MVSKKHSKHGQTDYRYDHTGRIEGCRNQRYWETLQYDAAANLLDSKYREDYSNHNLIRCNQLLHFRGHHYRYDEHGRTASKQTIGATQHYHYDAEHRLSEVRIEQLNKTERYRYLYDALGRRIEKHQIDREGKPYNRTRFLWDGLRMIQETGPNHPTSLYIYTDQNSYEPLARIDTDGNQEQHIRYFHTDLNGCPEELTDENGEILWECSFQLWGKRIHEIEHEPIEQNLRYQGQYLDRETGLHYNTFRYYDPDIGRFTQPDPIGLLGGFNLYQYAPNPLSWIDPLGLKCDTASGKNRKFWKKDPIEFKGNKVYQRNDLFDPNLMTTWRNKGKVFRGTNIERMATGRAPIGYDGKAVNLHHMLQTQNGPIAEMSQAFHKTNHRVIHINPNSIPSGTDRAAFNEWRKQYWINRASGFL